MPPIRWIDKTQPQTLMMATLLMYINAAFGLIYGQEFFLLGGVPVGVILIVGQVVSGLGIANEKKWGYWLGVVLTAIFLAYVIASFSFLSVLNLLFYGALLALLLHPQSREYRRVWFR
jgi:chromate transport protein ChrA